MLYTSTRDLPISLGNTILAKLGARALTGSEKMGVACKMLNGFSQLGRFLTHQNPPLETSLGMAYLNMTDIVRSCMCPGSIHSSADEPALRQGLDGDPTAVYLRLGCLSSFPRSGRLKTPPRVPGSAEMSQMRRRS